MDIDRMILKSCGCISLRAMALLIGLLHITAGSMSVLQELVAVIVYAEHYGEHVNNRIYSTVQLLLYEATASIEILFSIFLVLGILIESSHKSAFVFSWLLLKGTSAVTLLLETAITAALFFHHYLFLIEEIIVLTFFSLEFYAVYSYYRSISKKLHS